MKNGLQLTSHRHMVKERLATNITLTSWSTIMELSLSISRSFLWLMLGDLAESIDGRFVDVTPLKDSLPKGWHQIAYCASGMASDRSCGDHNSYVYRSEPTRLNAVCFPLVCCRRLCLSSFLALSWHGVGDICVFGEGCKYSVFFSLFTYFSEWPYSTSPPGGNQVDGLPPV